MKQFSIPKDTIRKLLRYQCLISGVYYIVLLGLIFLSGYLSSKYSRNSLYFTVIIFFIMFLYWFIRQVSQKAKYYKSYSIIIDGNHITELYSGVTQSSFSIERAVKTKRGGFWVTGGGIQIYIAPYIGEKEVLENYLPITDKKIYKERNTILIKLIDNFLLLFAALIACFILGNKLIMTLAAGILFIGLGLSFVVIQLGKNVNQDEKRKSYGILIFIIILIVYWIGLFFGKS